MNTKKRIVVMKALFVILLGGLSIRLYFLQVKPSERVQANYTNHQTEIISDMSYMLLDKNGKDLSSYDKDYVVVIDSEPFKLNNYGESMQGLLAFNFIMKEENRDFSFNEIMKVHHVKKYYNVSRETYNKINALKDVKGVYTYVYDRRDTKEAWSIDGMFSNLDKVKAKKDTLEDKLQQTISKNKLPKINLYRDGKAVYTKRELVDYSENKNIKMTVDKEIDKKIKDVLLDPKYKEYKNIGVILMESKSGKIRSMVQKDESEPNVNLGIQGVGYEPGSIYKIITYAVALEKGLITPDTTYVCKGKEGNCKNAYHGKISAKDAVVKSCNSAFTEIGALIGEEELMKYTGELGVFNRVLNIDSENKTEAKGTIDNKNAGIGNLAIGQSMTVTPIQMIGAINTIFNEGIYVKPQIIEEVLDSQEKKIEEYKVQERMVFSKLTSGMVKNSMREVVLYGTGKKANIPGVEIYGKTGSGTFSEKNKNNEILDKTHCWFTGNFKINGIEYAMNVIVPNVYDEKDKASAGGTVAAPIYRDIVEKIK